MKHIFLVALFLGSWVLTDAQEAVHTTRIQSTVPMNTLVSVACWISTILKISKDFPQWSGFMEVV